MGDGIRFVFGGEYGKGAKKLQENSIVHGIGATSRRHLCLAEPSRCAQLTVNE